MADSAKPDSAGAAGDKATQTQRPAQVPGSQGPATPDTSKQAGTVQAPSKK